ncbi:hypothetical protein [Shewanella halifaxensis]|uniref:hypothetical protein n=1 Tax=Shewanella halifaxensis TaxID=271098 RepID=UPI0013A66562|nr:hypothetical protein [Shewanella halifaxensis]
MDDNDGLSLIKLQKGSDKNEKCLLNLALPLFSTKYFTDVYYEGLFMTVAQLNRTQLKEQRLQDLLDSCQDQVLQQIIGPFGLTPAMFNDKDGGNVTTTRNFEQGVTATKEDQQSYEDWQAVINGGYDRAAYDAELPGKRKEIFKGDKPIISQYTGNELTKDGQTHLDHVVAAKTIETDSRAHLFMSQEQRVATANQDANLVVAEGRINQSMQDKDKLEWAEAQRKADKGKTNAESFGVNKELLEQTDKKAKKAVNGNFLNQQIKKQGAELLTTGAKDAGKMALRQALGVLIHELVKGVFIEIKKLFNTPKEENIIDKLIAAIKRVAKRVLAKFKDAGKSALGGGIQGFFSNLLTFLINNLIKTSAKVVTIIRESIKSIWQAVKFIVNPPKNLSALEVTREVTKILTVAVATGLGMFFEEAIQTFIMSIPILSPIAGIIAPAIAAILTGVATALLVYGLDRFFDWLSDDGTQLLSAFENNLDAMKDNINKMASWIEEQYNQSQNYVEIAAGYGDIQRNFDVALNANRSALQTSQQQTKRQIAFNQKLTTDVKIITNQELDVGRLLKDYKLGEH